MSYPYTQIIRGLSLYKCMPIHPDYRSGYITIGLLPLFPDDPIQVLPPHDDGMTGKHVLHY